MVPRQWTDNGGAKVRGNRRARAQGPPRTWAKEMPRHRQQGGAHGQDRTTSRGSPDDIYRRRAAMLVRQVGPPLMGDQCMQLYNEANQRSDQGRYKMNQAAAPAGGRREQVVG